MKKLYSYFMCLFIVLSFFLLCCGNGSDAGSGGSKNSETSFPANDHEYVDLGLPSGTMWATCNVGANNPWEYGGKYAWGETAEKKEYSWSTYQLCTGILGEIKKYCTNKSYGRVDGKRELEIIDDVAHVQWGGDWRMPTVAEFDELRRLCKWEWMSVNGVFGYKVIGRNGNSIFLPAAEHDNYQGFYWASEIDIVNNHCACFLDFNVVDGHKYTSSKTERYIPHSVRPVLNPTKNNILPKTNKIINGHEYVDLGLPSGLKWATCNVGANNPWEDGGYYAWGETEEKSNYDRSTYKWCRGSFDNMTKYCIDSRWGRVDNKTVLDPEDDVAHVKWGGSWRMPTKEEMDELSSCCIWQSITLNGKNGYKVTGPNGNSIFLPAAGYCAANGVNNRASNGSYRSSSLFSEVNNYAYSLSFDYFNHGYGSHGCSGSDRIYGCCVRPVLE